MMKILELIIIFLCYMYYFYQISHIEKGLIKLIVLFSLVSLEFGALCFLKLEYLAWITCGIILLLYDLFYDKEIFKYQWYKIILPIVYFSFGSFIGIQYIYLSQGFFIYSFSMISYYRNYFSIVNTFFISIMYSIFIVFIYFSEKEIYKLCIFLLSIVFFMLMEFVLNGYQKGFEKNTVCFQQNILTHQYEEIKNIYLNMRGWRHDYHNHIQTIKAHLTLNQIDMVKKYLNSLEEDLDKVDQYVKSGNLMIDAILNSKLSVAKKENIQIICKAEVSENLNISEIDLCVILGNLLDNAIESCMKIDNGFIRIYIAIIHKQLYISVQNSAKEILNFDERNYITTKRGNHGLGMKRVKLLVDKYEGYLNLQNEPGIFASEVTLPLK